MDEALWQSLRYRKLKLANQTVCTTLWRTLAPTPGSTPRRVTIKLATGKTRRATLFGPSDLISEAMKQVYQGLPTWRRAKTSLGTSVKLQYGSLDY